VLAKNLKAFLWKLSSKKNQRLYLSWKFRLYPDIPPYSATFLRDFVCINTKRFFIGRWASIYVSRKFGIDKITTEIIIQILDCFRKKYNFDISHLLRLINDEKFNYRNLCYLYSVLISFGMFTAALHVRNKMRLISADQVSHGASPNLSDSLKFQRFFFGALLELNRSSAFVYSNCPIHFRTTLENYSLFWRKSNLNTADNNFARYLRGFSEIHVEGPSDVDVVEMDGACRIGFKGQVIDRPAYNILYVNGVYAEFLCSLNLAQLIRKLGDANWIVFKSSVSLSKLENCNEFKKYVEHRNLLSKPLELRTLCLQNNLFMNGSLNALPEALCDVYSNISRSQSVCLTGANLYASKNLYRSGYHQHGPITTSDISVRINSFVHHDPLTQFSVINHFNKNHGLILGANLAKLMGMGESEYMKLLETIYGESFRQNL
jgi:hypothetical protein